MPDLWLDHETISQENVGVAGLYRHAADMNTDIIMSAYAVDRAPVKLWKSTPERGTVSTPPPDLEALLNDPDVLVWAHNAAYERILTREVWGIDVPLSRWRDSAVVARWYNYPHDLKSFTARMLGTAGKKLDSANFKYLWSTSSLPWDAQALADFEDMGRYCIRDVESMRAAVLQLPALPLKVWQEYAASEAINDRGVFTDFDFANGVAYLRKALDKEIRSDIAELTEGAVTTPRGAAARKWAESVLADTHPELLNEDGQLTRDFKKRREGSAGFTTVNRGTFDKPMRRNIREHVLRSDVAAHPALLDVLDAVDEGQNAAITKYEAISNRVSTDGRLRGMYVFAGAGQTHRFSSTGAQTHNLLRDVLALDDDADLREAVAESSGQLAPLYQLAPVIKDGLGKTLSKAVRPTLIAAPGKMLVWGDWSAIEARGLPWLALDEEKLERFRQGIDVYIRNAAALYGLPEASIDGGKRQVGKVQELALGFGGAVGAFAAMSRGYGVSLTNDQMKRAVTTWRAANPLIVDFWKHSMRAAFEAMRNPGKVIDVEHSRISYVFAPNVAHGALLVAMPDGSMLVYPQARCEYLSRFEDGEPEPTIIFEHPTYGPSGLWHGTLVENVTQGICASLMRYALKHCEDIGLAVVMHTHDEIVLEVPEGQADEMLALLIKIMRTAPDWAMGLPLDAEGGIGTRYKIKDSAY